jgi:hypothetical protein
MSEMVEKMMKEYQHMLMEISCLENQIKNFRGISEEDMIDSMYFSKGEGECIQTSEVSDKTARIAISYRQKMLMVDNEWQNHLLKKYSMLRDDLLFFESAVLSLSGFLPDLISDMIIKGLTWDDLAIKYHISRSMVAKYRKKAIKELEILYTLHDKEIAEYILS